MIRLTLPSRPDFLTDEFVKQQTDKFKSNPKTRVWNIQGLKEALLKASHGKCAFSEIRLNEEGKYMQVEHFYPKSKYPEKVLEWGNLLPCANICNTNKRDHDPLKHPLVNPFFDDPKEHFYFDNGRLLPIDSKDKKAINTLKAYDLNNPTELRIPRINCLRYLKNRLLLFENTVGNNLPFAKNQLKSLLSDCGRTSAYSALKSTIVLEDETYKRLREVLIHIEEWDNNFMELEKELVFCSLPKPDGEYKEFSSSKD